ncbi:MAG: arylesterase [Balneolaceae bacterium]|nr:MAG: arylesterase [Balneolaceae bacterium]
MILLFLLLLAFAGQNRPDNGPVNILFFGDSITAGYGIDQDQAFPAIIQMKIDSLNWNARAINAGLSGETSSGGLRRVDWLLRQRIDVMVLELGGNDGLRGIDLNLTRSNLQQIIDKTRSAYPDVEIVIAGMQVPPNLGQHYTDQFRALFPDLAEKNNLKLIPFILEDVAGIPELNLPDGIHPSPEGHQIMAETVWKFIRPIVQAKL